MQAKPRFKVSLFVAASLLVVGAISVACSSVTKTVEPIDADRASSPPITWGPAPAVFEPGAEMAVVQGDPSKAGEPFTVRLRMPNGYRIAPHTHPTDENVTVISGTFKVGMGATFKEDSMLTLPAGAFVTAPALHAHYASTKGQTIVQVNAIGPFAINYVNASDVPAAARQK
ncbi:MAG: cupin domain-containing protein [Gemmatimonas sp.]